MDRLTSQDVEAVLGEGVCKVRCSGPCLCSRVRDLALRSLSQEAVLDEYARGLKYALDVVLDTDEQSECGDELTMIADAIREELSLKREPNAAGRGLATAPPVTSGPAPAAPDVAIVLAQLDGIAKHMRAAYPNLEGDAYWLDQTAALLARLGQGWIPVSNERPQNSRPVLIQWYDGDSDGMLVAQYNGIRWTYDGGIVPLSTEVTHWMPLPLPPGASDD